MLSRLPPVSNSHDQDDDRENDDWPHKYDKIGRHSRRFRCGCGSWDAHRFEDGPPAEEHGWETHHHKAMKQNANLDVRLMLRHFLIKSWLYPQARFAPCLLAFLDDCRHLACVPTLNRKKILFRVPKALTEPLSLTVKEPTHLSS